jgi:hypothetical protein
VRTVFLAAFFACVASTGGCRSVAEAPQDMKPAEAYQTVANQLPELDLGWGESPAIARMAASERGRGEPPKRDLSCNDTRFKLYLEVLHPRIFDVRYDTLEEVSFTYSLFPNIPLCVVFPFFQMSTVRVVFDARKVDGLLGYLEDECERLERISPEIGMSGPYDHAMAVRSKMHDDAKEFGEGRLSFEVGFWTPVPPFIPYTAQARHVAEAFAWAKAHASH